MTRPVDLTALSTDFRILPTSPPWSATQRALDQLDRFRETRRNYERFDDDIASVGNFAKMLAANQRVLTLALVCGAVVGRFNGGSFGESVSAGLRAIKDVYGFGEPTRAVTTIAKTLEGIAEEITTRWPVLTNRFTQLETLLKQQKHDEWSAALHETANVIANDVTFTDPDRQEAVETAWREWRRFLLITGDDGSLEPGFDNVLCRAANIGPYTVVRDHPAEMPLAEWSSAYCRALLHPSIGDREFAPAWLAVVAALRLAPLPSRQVQSELRQFVPKLLDPVDVQLITTSPISTTAPASRLSGLIVYGDASSVGSWRVPVEYAAVAWTVKQSSEALTILQAAGRQGPLWTPIDHVFIETTVNEQDARTIINVLAAFPRASHALSVIAFAFDRNAAKPAWAERIVQQPEDAVALMRTAEARRIADASALPNRTKILFESGARLTGSFEDAPEGRRTDVEVEFLPRETDVEVTWSVNRRSFKASMSFAGDLLVRRRFVTRRYAILYDGVTIRAEQRAMYLLQLDNAIVRLLTRLFVDELSFEFKEETQGWAVELTARPAQGKRPERRTRIRLFNVATSPTASSPAPSKMSS